MTQLAIDRPKRSTAVDNVTISCFQELQDTSFLFPLPPPLGLGLLPFCTPALMSLPSDPSMFDILNLFRRQWFLSRDWLVSNVASAQRTDGSSINWVEFPPAAHTHLVRCAIKLAPSVPAAKVKWVMFVYLLEVLNNDSPVLSFFAPCRIHMPHKQRTRKPRVGGAQPVGTMAIDSPPPVAPSQPDPPGPLSPGLVPGYGSPSSEEPAGDGFNVTSGRASSSPGVSPTPSNRMVMPVSPLRPGPSRPPSVLGVRHSPPPDSPSPPSSPPVPLPSSPPPRIGTSGTWLPQDWRDWIAKCQHLAGRKGKSFWATTDDLAAAVAVWEDMECALLRQAANTRPLVEATLMDQVAPGHPLSTDPLHAQVGPPAVSAQVDTAIATLHSSAFRCYLLSAPSAVHQQWLTQNGLVFDFVIPPP